MTVHEIASLLLLHFAPEERSIPDAQDYPGRNAAVLQSINGALQELFGEASPWVRHDEFGVVLHAPTSVSIAVMNGSTAAEISADDWQEWFAGCTLVIEGATIDNQIRNASRQVRLKYPHDGSTGTVLATVYHDSVTLDPGVQKLVEPVRVAGRQIHPVPSVSTLGRTPAAEDFGFRPQSATPPVARVSQTAGTPSAYAVETWIPDVKSSPAPRMQLWPAPAAQVFIDYRAMLAAPVLNSIVSSDTLPIPLQYVDSIFLPLARKRLTACPFFRDISGADEIARASSEAKSLLNSLNPRTRSGARIVPLY